MGADSCTACYCRCSTCKIQRREFCNSRKCCYDSGCHCHGNCGRTNADPYKSRYHKGYYYDRKVCRRNCVSDHFSKSGILKHVTENAAAGCYQKDKTCRLQRFCHNLFQLFSCIAVSDSKNKHCCHCCDQKGYKRLSQEGEYRSQSAERRNYSADRVHNNQYKRNQNDSDNSPEIRQL